MGEPAKKQASVNPTNTIYDFKRIIGRSLDDAVVREGSRRFPYLFLDGGEEKKLKYNYIIKCYKFDVNAKP